MFQTSVDIRALLAISLLSMVSTATSAQDTTRQKRIRQSIAKAIPLIEKAAAGTAKQRDCFTCHGQAMPVVALVEAAKYGFEVDKRNIETQISHTAAFFKRSIKQYESGKGTGGQVDTAGWALWCLEAGNVSPNKSTNAVVKYLLAKQKKNGGWRCTSRRPPSEASHFTATYLALRALQEFGTGEYEKQSQAAAKKSAGWFNNAKPKDTEDRVFQLLTLPYLESKFDRQKLSTQLQKQQKPNGGWSQTDKLKADPYATATVLYALAESECDPSEPVFQKGIDFLIDCQHKDGSWSVKSRSKPFQEYFETGYPHGKDQFISTTTACWAVIALTKSLAETQTISQQNEQQLKGVVVDHDDKPVPYAKVWGHTVGQSIAREADKSGRFTIDFTNENPLISVSAYANQTSVTLRLSDASKPHANQPEVSFVDPNGKLVNAVDLAKSDDEFTIRLSRPDLVNYRIVSPKGQPVANAVVTPKDVHEVLRPFLRAKTNANGRVRLKKLTAMTVQADGFGTQELRFFRGRPFEIALEPVFMAQARLTEEVKGEVTFGVGVRSVRYFLYHASGFYERTTIERPNQGQPNSVFVCEYDVAHFDGGQFVGDTCHFSAIEGTPITTVTLFDRKQPLRLIMPKRKAVTQNPPTIFRIKVQRAIRVVGRVVDQHQVPVANATIQLSKRIEKTTSKDDGTFELLLTPPKPQANTADRKRAIDIRKSSSQPDLAYESYRHRFVLKPGQLKVELGDLRLRTFKPAVIADK